MAKDLEEQLTRIGHKAELLATHYSTLKQENARLRTELSDCRVQILALKGDLEKARIELEHLRISSALTPSSKTLAETRAYISDLVREIDACVDDLIRDV